MPQRKIGVPLAGDTYIYFAGTEIGAEEIKLGRGDDPIQRIKRQASPNGRDEPLRLLAVVRGSFADEEHLKRHFAAHRSRPRLKEWIKAGPNDEARAYLRWLMSRPFVATREDAEVIAALPPVPADEWLPDGARSKHFAQAELPTSNDRWADMATSVVMEGDFYTGLDIIEPARRVMGVIDLDPASCPEANTVVRAVEHFGIKENGLLRDWYGRVWLNPPFGRWGQGWAPKAVQEWHRGRVEQMCLLASTRSITAQGFLPIKMAADAVWIGHGRIPFWGPKATSGPDEGHVVFYFGARRREFVSEFEESGLGTVYERPIR